MKLSDIRNKETKFHQLIHDDAYKIIEYKNEIHNISEFIWNSTNLPAPDYILDTSNKFKLGYISRSKSEFIIHKMKIGERFFGYKTPSSYIKDRTPILKFYWEKNFFNCNTSFSSYEEFFAISCVNMTKQRLELKVYNGIQ